MRIVVISDKENNIVDYEKREKYLLYEVGGGQILSKKEVSNVSLEVDALICNKMTKENLNFFRQHHITIFYQAQGDCDSAIHSLLVGQLGTPND